MKLLEQLTAWWHHRAEEVPASGAPAAAPARPIKPAAWNLRETPMPDISAMRRFVLRVPRSDIEGLDATALLAKIKEAFGKA